MTKVLIIDTPKGGSYWYKYWTEHADYSPATMHHLAAPPQVIVDKEFIGEFNIEPGTVLHFPPNHGATVARNILAKYRQMGFTRTLEREMRRLRHDLKRRLWLHFAQHATKRLLLQRKRERFWRHTNR